MKKIKIISIIILIIALAFIIGLFAKALSIILDIIAYGLLVLIIIALVL